MHINRIGTKSTVAAALFIILSACSSSSDNAETSNTTIQLTQVPTNDNSTPSNDNSTIENDGGENAATDTETTNMAVFGPAQYITSECGSMEVSAKVSTNSVNTPSELLVGELVSGQIVPNSETDNFHVWQVSLEPGNYHLVADISDLGEERSAIGMSIVSLAPSTSDNVTLASSSTFDFDLRLYEYLEIQRAQTMTLKVESQYDSIHNYTFGIFSNRSAVPSPTFERCLPINTLSLNSTQSVALPGAATRAEDNWYLIDLERGGYMLDASATSAEDTIIGYRFHILDQFGQTDRLEQVSSSSAFDTLLTTVDTFERDEKSPTWIRIRNAYNGRENDRTIEFTVSPQ